MALVDRAKKSAGSSEEVGAAQKHEKHTMYARVSGKEVEVLVALRVPDAGALSALKAAGGVSTAKVAVRARETATYTGRGW